MMDIRHGTCPLCQHREIIESRPKLIDDQYDRVPSGGCQPMALTHELDTTSIAHFGLLIPRKPLGELSTFTCRSCGFTQWFARAPAEVPIGPKHDTRLCTPDANGPYR